MYFLWEMRDVDINSDDVINGDDISYIYRDNSIDRIWKSSSILNLKAI